RARGSLEGRDDPLVERRRGQRLAVFERRSHAALARSLLRERGDLAGDAAEGFLVHTAHVEREARLRGDDVDDPRAELELPDRADGAFPLGPGKPLKLEDALGGGKPGVETE